MRIGSSIGLIVLGAILAFAVAVAVPGVNLELVGYILMGAGVVGLVASLILNGRSNHRVTESRTAVDPGTGESITRNETKDNGMNREPLL